MQTPLHLGGDMLYYVFIAAFALVWAAIALLAIFRRNHK
jgi:hypothetical protein